MDLINWHTKVKESREQDRHEIRDLLLSILSNHDTKNLIRDIRPVEDLMGSIQTVSIDLFE